VQNELHVFPYLTSPGFLRRIPYHRKLRCWLALVAKTDTDLVTYLLTLLTVDGHVTDVFIVAFVGAQCERPFRLWQWLVFDCVCVCVGGNAGWTLGAVLYENSQTQHHCQLAAAAAAADDDDDGGGSDEDDDDIRLLLSRLLIVGTGEHTTSH